ncbi:nucleotidyl transferase AbiEii/AbiGii toxin family protein [Listeria sp. W9-0585]|uniref:Nucleotidyl transferase AbiEii/AbiGii toxin family protein n=1 Tax=Listeria rustica TaxID=2713503 RepID=A0A7W1T8J5_9LIST|nr:nucleotidyl transferase AbiEii/AbiGii toxin family protein [Listeria rustica]
MDITTGDSIYPEVKRYAHKMMFENKFIDVYAYPVEQILAEKLHSILDRGLANTRARDFYDIYMLTSMERNLFNYPALALSVKNTFVHRNFLLSVEDYFNERMEAIKHSQDLQLIWSNYARSLPHAEELSYSEVVASVERLLLDIIALEEVKD